MNASELPRSPAFHIFPLYGIVRDDQGVACTCAKKAACRDIGKHPMVAWRTHDENARGPSGGYGIQTGHFNGIVVVDLDVKPNGQPPKNGIAAFEALAAGRPIPDTLSVITPSGGVHLYFRLPPDLYVPKSLSVLGPGIDILGEGGYVVGPGSPHKNGGIYQEVPETLADLPDWLLALVVKQPKPLQLVVTEHYTEEPGSPRWERAVAWTREYLARAEPAIEHQRGHDRFYAVCCHLMYSALPLAELHRLVEEVYNPRCVPPWSHAEIAHKLTNADQRSDQPPRGLCSLDFFDRMHERTKNTDLRTPDPLHEYSYDIGMRSSGETRRATFGEVCADLFDHKNWAGVLMFDTFQECVMAIDPPMKMDAETSGLSDNDARLVRAWFEYHGKKITLQDTREAIETVARKNKSNCVVNWLKTLEWDGRARLDRVLPEYFQSPDTPYECAIGPRWFISLIARAMQPGCQVDYTLILEGEQEYRKSSALLSLMHDSTWYAENQSEVGTKDFYENMRGVWVMGFDELASLTNADSAKMKSALTRRHDRFRKSYGHYSNNYVRGTVFAGTIDCSTYLKDAAGGRRFWPVKVQRPIDTNKIERDRDQIFAEALARWERGDVWYVNTPELQALCKTEQEERFEVDSWEEAVLKWLNDPTRFTRNPAPEEPGSVFKGVRPFDGSKGFTTSDALKYAIDRPTSQQTRADATRIGTILRRLKMEVIRVRVPGGQERRYVFSR